MINNVTQDGHVIRWYLISGTVRLKLI